MTPPEFWLMAATVFSLLGALGSLGGTVFQFPNWGLAAVRLGLIGGILCSAVLTFLLFNLEFNTLPSVHISVWAWISMTLPRQTSLVFGLATTWVKACLASIVGGVLLAHQFHADAKMGRKSSENIRLVDSLLYLALTTFLYAPNLAQSLLSWLAISFLICVLIRMPSESNESQRSRSLRFSRESREENITDTNRGVQRLSRTLSIIARFVRERVWAGIVRNIPNWLGEQLEVIQESTVAFQLLATILGSFAVLLTWLIVG